jgi:hypothetical protein
MTRREAAEYLRWTVEEVDARLIPLSGYAEGVRGRMRYLPMEIDGDLRVRILAADVFSVLPLPLPLPGAAAPDYWNKAPQQAQPAAQVAQ